MKGHYPNNAESLDQYRQALDFVKQAAVRPDYRINQPALSTFASPNPYDVGMINNLARLVILDAQDRLVHQRSRRHMDCPHHAIPNGSAYGRWRRDRSGR